MRCTVFSFLMLWASCTLAQQVASLDTVVVTATRHAKLLKDVPVRTEVISRETLQKEHARDAKEALRYAAGVLLKPVHGKTGFEAWLQGMDGNRVLVLVNGERVSASTGSTVDLTQISVADIKQVEIVKGAASALHGSSAMGGVVNIITRESAQGWHGKITADAGSYGDYDRAGGRRPAAIYAKGALSYRGEKLDVSVDADQRDSDGFLIPGRQPSNNINGQDGYKRNINTRLAYKASDQLNFNLAFRGYEEDHIVHSIEFIPGLGNSSLPRFETVDSQHYSAGLGYRVNDADSLKLKVYQENFKNRTFQKLVRLADISTTGTDLQYDLAVNSNAILTAGLATNEESLDQLNNGVAELQGGKRTRDSKEAFLQYDYWLTDNIELLPGIRYQDDSDFGTHSAPKLSLMFSHESGQGDGRLRASYGNGYRVPNMKERYFIFDHSVNGYKVLGNPNLQPEQSDSFQLGYEWQDRRRWGADVNFFYNDIEDLIETSFVGGEQGVRIFRYINLSKAQTQGTELGGYIEISDQVKLKGSYTYLQTENKTPGENLGKDLAKRPENLLKLSLDWSVFDGHGDFLLRYVYQSKEFVDEANTLISSQTHIWDVKYTHKLKSNFSIYGGVDNIGNVHREPGSGSDLRPVPGRFVYAGASFSF